MIAVQPIGYVESMRPHAEDDFWGGEQSCIALVEEYGPDAIEGLTDFSHVEILYFFHEVADAKITKGARHPVITKHGPRSEFSRSEARIVPTDSGVPSVAWFEWKARDCLWPNLTP